MYGEPNDRRIRPTEFYTLDQHGDYIYRLEVKYTDGSTSIDERIVSVLSQIPITQYALSSMGISDAGVGVDIDSEGKLWISTSTKQCKIKPSYHYMLLDFDSKILYTREKYDSIEVY